MRADENGRMGRGDGAMSEVAKERHCHIAHLLQGC